MDPKSIDNKSREKVWLGVPEIEEFRHEKVL